MMFASQRLTIGIPSFVSFFTCTRRPLTIWLFINLNLLREAILSLFFGLSSCFKRSCVFSVENISSKLFRIVLKSKINSISVSQSCKLTVLILVMILIVKILAIMIILVISHSKSNVAVVSFKKCLCFILFANGSAGWLIEPLK